VPLPGVNARPPRPVHIGPFGIHRQTAAVNAGSTLRHASSNILTRKMVGSPDMASPDALVSLHFLPGRGWRLATFHGCWRGAAACGSTVGPHGDRHFRGLMRPQMFCRRALSRHGRRLSDRATILGASTGRFFPARMKKGTPFHRRNRSPPEALRRFRRGNPSYALRLAVASKLSAQADAAGALAEWPSALFTSRPRWFSLSRRTGGSMRHWSENLNEVVLDPARIVPSGRKTRRALGRRKFLRQVVSCSTSTYLSVQRGSMKAFATGTSESDWTGCLPR